MSTFAECGPDYDWPERPCYDVGTPSQDEVRTAWAKYYDYKGKEWMENKKAEMDQAITDGTLQEWILNQSEPNNSANYNVYYYYHLNGQAPSVELIDSGTSVVSTQWEMSTAGWATLVGIGIAAVAGITIIFVKSRRVHH